MDPAEEAEAAVPAGSCFVVKFTLPEGEEELGENCGGTVHVRGVKRTFPTVLEVKNDGATVGEEVATMAIVSAASYEETPVAPGQIVSIFGEDVGPEQLEVFDPHEGVELFNEYSQAILSSPRSGHEKAMHALEKVTDDPSSARLLLRVCLAVAEASGEKSLSQEIEMMMLCNALGIDPKAVGLYQDGELPRGATS